MRASLNALVSPALMEERYLMMRKCASAFFPGPANGSLEYRIRNESA